MSSEIEAIGLIAAPLVLPVAAAYGAGWLAWKAGKLLVDANREVDRQIAEQKRQQEEEARHRKMSAIAAHNQLKDMCSQILYQIENNSSSGNIISFAEIEQLKYDLKKICEETVPDDTAQIESLTSLGYLKLDEVVRQQQQIAALKLEDSEAGLYRGLSVADLMDDLRIAIAAMDIKATTGKNVKAADPAVLERAKLNESFIAVTNQIMIALETVSNLTSTYGLNQSGSAWFHSCFNGVDTLIERLCKPTTSNKELKKGIQRLKESMEQYEIMAPSIEEEIKRMVALYEVYVDASKALGEKVESIQAFKTSNEIEEKLKYLQTRAEKARECAEIYQKLGASAYLCYAWDRELQEMGYEVHTRKKITEMATRKPSHAKIGENKLPFYEWNEEDLTQLYSITSDCALQVIVHDDGTVSMQTIADGDNAETVAVQQKHCEQLKTLHERLRKNWFILYDYEETAAANKITTVAGWRTSEDYAWKDNELITDQRAKDKTTENTQRLQ